MKESPLASCRSRLFQRPTTDRGTGNFTQSGPVPGKNPNSPCWMELSNQPGCYVWTSYFIPDKAMSWTGGCGGEDARTVGDS